MKLQIWDFAGSDRFVSISKSRLEEAHGIIIVFDITNQESFQDLERHWGQELAKHKLKPGVARILVANKVDLADRRVVDPNSAKQVAEEYGGKYIETSAKMSTNVNQMFETIARDMFVEWQKNQKPDHWREEEKKSSKRKCILQEAAPQTYLNISNSKNRFHSHLLPSLLQFSRSALFIYRYLLYDLQQQNNNKG